MILALAGGVGGAKLALGLSRILPLEELQIVVNTGDDFTHLGFRVCPDLDTVMYTLGGVANPETGWGLAGETWSFMDALRRIGGESWFLLGDRDLATHVERTRRLAQGETLTEVTRALAGRFGVKHLLAPVSDAVIASVILSGSKRLSFQGYFVRERTLPVFNGIIYEGAETAPLSAALAGVLQDSNLHGVIICPSNTYLSIGPMLAIPALRSWLERRTCKVVAVSPIIGGDAVKGPMAKMLREMQEEVSPVSIAAYYRGLIDELIIDTADSSCANRIAALGIRAIPAPILMRSLADREALASLCVQRCKARWI